MGGTSGWPRLMTTLVTGIVAAVAVAPASAAHRDVIAPSPIPPTRHQCEVIAAVVEQAPAKDVHPPGLGVKISAVVVGAAGLPEDDLRTRVSPLRGKWPPGSFDILACPKVSEDLRRRRW